MLDGMTGWQNDYAGSLDASVVKGMRVGVLDFARNDSPRLNAQFDAAIARMEAGWCNDCSHREQRYAS
jgi:hypothetical protein